MNRIKCPGSQAFFQTDIDVLYIHPVKFLCIKNKKRRRTWEKIIMPRNEFEVLCDR